jgi:indole-3-glycerol phosphate synthase
LIKSDADPAKIAAEYEIGGAAAVSVLTEEDRFKGSLDDLRNVRSAVKIPVLRKDFIFDEYQVYESAAAGADALLLIVAALTDEVLLELLRITESNLQMDALVEVHTSQEIERAIKAGARMIGVNNRNLRTFEVSLDTSFELVKVIPSDAIAIAESGLKTRDDLRNLARAGFKGFLIGETLMRSGDPKAALLKLMDDRGSA